MCYLYFFGERSEQRNKKRVGCSLYSPSTKLVRLFSFFLELSEKIVRLHPLPSPSSNVEKFMFGPGNDKNATFLVEGRGG